MPRSSPALALAFVAAVFTGACSKQEPETVTSQAQSSNADEVIAYVNDSPITASRLETAKSRFKVNAALLDARFDETLLQSLVSSRAMSLLVAKELDEDELARLGNKVAAYREELLVKEYLQRHAQPEPVSEAMVKAYYEKHPEAFSGGVRKAFEYYESNGEIGEAERKRVLDFLAAAKGERDWSAQLKAQGGAFPLSYRTAKAKLAVLDEPLKTLVASTGVGQVSSVHMGERIILVRVLEEEHIPPRPLHEVSADIRKKLAPVQLREAVKSVSEQALAEVTVHYPGRSE